jgi:hypothetical protein
MYNPLALAWRSHGISHVPAVQDESCGDHKREEDVERHGNRKEWDGGVERLRSRCLPDCEDWYMSTIPIAVSVTSAESIAVGLWRARARTKRGEPHQAWEGDDPVVHGIDDVATIELE